MKETTKKEWCFMNKKAKISVSAILGMLVGIFSVLGGFGGWFTSGYYDHVIHTTYGGDAYTGIQNAAADTANNVSQLGYGLNDALNWLFVILGAAIFCYFLGKLIKKDTSAPGNLIVAPMGQTQPTGNYAPSMTTAPMNPVNPVVAQPVVPTAPVAPAAPVAPTTPPMV
jgi:hypothetical protein